MNIELTTHTHTILWKNNILYDLYFALLKYYLEYISYVYLLNVDSRCIVILSQRMPHYPATLRSILVSSISQVILVNIII